MVQTRPLEDHVIRLTSALQDSEPLVRKVGRAVPEQPAVLGDQAGVVPVRVEGVVADTRTQVPEEELLPRSVRSIAPGGWLGRCGT